MDVLWSVLVIVISFLIGKIYLPLKRRRERSLKLSNGVKSPEKHWLFGHLLEFPASENGLLRSANRAVRFPAMSMMWFGPTEAALECYHPDTVKPLLASSVPKATFAYKFLRPWLGDSILLSAGEEWKCKRKLLSPAFSSKALESYVPKFNEVTGLLVEKLQCDGTAQDIYKPVNLMALDAVLRCFLSREMKPQEESCESRPFVEAISSLNDMVIERIMKFHLWNDTAFQYSKLGKEFREACDIVHEEAEQIIRKRRLTRTQRNGETSNDAKPAVDFLDILLEGKDENRNKLTDKEIRNEVDTFLFAGHDTTSSAISWTIYNLARYPEHQEKCYQELSENISSFHEITWDEIPMLYYLTQCIFESMRLYPPITGVGRCPNQPITLSSRYDGNSPAKTVPTDSNVHIRIFDLHRHPDIWKNPQEFDPDRFSAGNVSERPAYSYIPFSQGNRNCIGQRFAMTLATVAIGRILLRYQLYLDEETPTPAMKPGVVLRSENGIHVKMKERQ